MPEVENKVRLVLLPLILVRRMKHWEKRLDGRSNKSPPLPSYEGWDVWRETHLNSQIPGIVSNRTLGIKKYAPKRDTSPLNVRHTKSRSVRDDPLENV